MSLADIQTGIYSRFGAQWNNNFYPSVAENRGWPNSKQPTGVPWCRLSVRFSANHDSSVDGKARRATGMIWLQIFLPEESGVIKAQEMGDAMEAMFAGQTIVHGAETIRCERAVTTFVGVTTDGLSQHRCTIDFISDSVT